MASHTVFDVVVLVAAVALYFLPAIIADRRRRHDLLIIAMVNAVLGWTVVGWLLALYWAFQPNPPADLLKQKKERERRIGMGLFSRKLSDRIAARAARGGSSDNRKGPFQ
ncbi:superinfection immunity protein [Paraburkholderia sp. J12]|uniref:superinfection immunity protein n=1 Tax=Paraburkholderia sp. J12 TaxID=2805432 RepID=UPI002ABE3815|nr:superinfection immunity protein [Paraburkholderia sp. J12]